MKKKHKNLVYIFCFMISIVGGLLFGKSDVFRNDGLTTMNIKNNVYGFGEIPQGIEVKTFFEYSNAVDSPLIITTTESRFGCTVANWNKDELG